jgi:hypothetical protein
MSKQFPIYTSHGEWVAMLVGRYLYSREGDWIGWVDAQSQVYSVLGEYAGWLSRDFRVLRPRDTSSLYPRREPPPRPPRVEMPMSVPLPTIVAELSYDTVDLFEEAPQRLDPHDMDQFQDID